jgi:hypothetical protein
LPVLLDLRIFIIVVIGTAQIFGWADGTAILSVPDLDPPVHVAEFDASTAAAELAA